MKHKKPILIAILLTGVVLLSGCTPQSKPVVKITESEMSAIVDATNSYVEREVRKLPTLKFKYAKDLLNQKSAFFSEKSSISTDWTTVSDETFPNATWVPKSKPVESSCSVNVPDEKGIVTVECYVDYGDMGTCTMSPGPFGRNSNGVPKSADDLYDSEGQPKFFFNCNYLLQEFPRAEDVTLISRPEKVRAGVEEISRALLAIGGCNYSEFEVRNIADYSNKFVKQYMVVSTHVDEEQGLGGDQMSYFDLWMWPQFDLYQLRGGLGWDSFFGCQLNSEGNPQRISASGKAVNDSLG